MKKITYYILAGMLIVSSACKKDFLDRYSQTTISPELFFKSEEDLSLYVNGLLSLPGTGSYLGDQNSDNSATTGNMEIKNIMTGTPSSQSITSGWDWGRLRDINYFLDNCGKTPVTQDVKDHYAGVARFYRARFYFDKILRYSDVPWYGRALNPSDPELFKGRDPRAMVVDSIMADLSFAAQHVRAKVPTGTPGLWAAKMLYARFALFEGTFRKYHPELNLAATAARFLDSARAQAQDIMNSGNFAIYNTGKPDQDYATLFSSQDLLQNKEVILTCPFDLNKGLSGNVNGTVFGDYEQSPSHDLVQTYLMKDGSRFTDVPGYDKMIFVQEFANRDPRMAQTLAGPGFVRAGDTKPYIQRLNKNFSGYHQLKGYINSTDAVVTGSADFPVYRYAEALLTYAEAKAEMNTLTQSDLDKSINLLRARAGMPSLNLGVALANPDPVLAAQYPDVTDAMKGAILEIRRERRVEYALEGYRFADLMRWHAGKLLENIPEGMFFPGLGKYDMTGDGIEDIILIDKGQDIPTDDKKEKELIGRYTGIL